MIEAKLNRSVGKLPKGKLFVHQGGVFVSKTGDTSFTMDLVMHSEHFTVYEASGNKGKKK